MRAIGGTVIVENEKTEKSFAFTSADELVVGCVVSVGEEVKDLIKKGERVFYSDVRGRKFKSKGKEYVTVNVSDIKVVD